MDRIDTIKVPKTLPRPAAAADVAKVLNTICSRALHVPGGRVEITTRVEVDTPSRTPAR
jgi:hypothetical protein